MKTGIELIAEERQRQIENEGWTPEHDDQHKKGEIAIAAGCYAMNEGFSDGSMDIRWPWADEWWKPTPGDRIRELQKAGALIAREIDRLIRLTQQTKQ